MSQVAVSCAREVVTCRRIHLCLCFTTKQDQSNSIAIDSFSSLSHFNEISIIDWFQSIFCLHFNLKLKLKTNHFTNELYSKFPLNTVQFYLQQNRHRLHQQFVPSAYYTLIIIEVYLLA